jgi:hypothetical protein
MLSVAARLLRTEYPMKFMIVFNHDTGVYSVHGDIVNESRARDVIAEQTKGRKITFLPYDATDKDAATREAERTEPNYHHVENALSE